MTHSMTRYRGLIAATFTPMTDRGDLALARIPAIVDALVASGIRGLYVCGSTGEGPSLSTEERMEVAAAYVGAAAGRVPAIVQVGHNALPDARALAAHAREIGADAVSATPPNYFKPDALATLIDTMLEIQEPARGLPFFYYHIPAMTAVPVDVSELLPRLAQRMPDLAGVKFSAPTVHEFAGIDRDRFQVLFGVDEMLVSGLVAGADGAVGSTYNLLAPLSVRIVDAVDRGAVEEARALQRTSTDLILRIVQRGGLPALKATMELVGLPCGPTRLPLRAVGAETLRALARELDAAGWSEHRTPLPNRG